MKAAAVFLLSLVMGLFYYYSDRRENLYHHQARREVPVAGPLSARPKAYNIPVEDQTRQALSDLKGKVVYINFWASWCAPCREEFPLIQKLQNEYGSSGFETVLVNMDSPGLIAEAKKLQAELAPNTRNVYENTRELQSILNIEALPFHMVIDREGRVAGAFYAALTKEEAKFRSLLQALLQESPGHESRE